MQVLERIAYVGAGFMIAVSAEMWLGLMLDVCLKEPIRKAIACWAGWRDPELKALKYELRVLKAETQSLKVYNKDLKQSLDCMRYAQHLATVGDANMAKTKDRENNNPSETKEIPGKVVQVGPNAYDYINDSCGSN